VVEPARAALTRGRGIINDVRGLSGDPVSVPLVAARGVGLIAMASRRLTTAGPPVETVLPSRRC
jgi:dihydropteroate synthase